MNLELSEGDHPIHKTVMIGENSVFHFLVNYLHVGNTCKLHLTITRIDEN